MLVEARQCWSLFNENEANLLNLNFRHFTLRHRFQARFAAQDMSSASMRYLFSYSLII